MDTTQIDVSMLPVRLQEFVHLIGIAPTLQLVEKYGGVRLYVPICPHPEHPLARLIGLDALTKLSAVYGSEDHFDIPKAAAAMRYLRNTRIIAERPEKSVRTLAREHNLTERQIRIICADGLNQISQPALF